MPVLAPIRLPLFVAFAAAASSVSRAASAQTAPAPSGASYTVTLPKRLLRLPPFATAELPKQLTFRVAVRVTPQASGAGRAVEVVTEPGGPTAADVFTAARMTVDGAGFATTYRMTFGPGGSGGGSAAPYRADIEARPSGPGVFRLTLPEQQGASQKSGAVLHPLSAQMFLGAQYDFKRGGPQTFALLLDWDGDSLNPAAQLATLRLESVGSEKVALKNGDVSARKLAYSVTGAADLPEKRRAGFFYIGPQGEILQTSNPSLWGIPFDNGKAVAPAAPDPEQPGLVMKTTNGETIRAARVGSSYEVALYGKPANPFAVATLDRNLQLVKMKETWNGRSRLADVTATEVRYRFTAGDLGTIGGGNGNIVFWPHFFLAGNASGVTSPFTNLTIGEKRDATFAPLLTNGAAWATTARAERLPDRALPLPGRTGRREGSVTHYRLTGTAEDRFTYNVYADGERLLVLTGDDGLEIVRDGWEEYARSVRPAPVVPPRPAP